MFRQSFPHVAIGWRFVSRSVKQIKPIKLIKLIEPIKPINVINKNDFNFYVYSTMIAGGIFGSGTTMYLGYNNAPCFKYMDTFDVFVYMTLSVGLTVLGGYVGIIAGVLSPVLVPILCISYCVSGK
jgi:hypothetical protein